MEKKTLTHQPLFPFNHHNHHHINIHPTAAPQYRESTASCFNLTSTPHLHRQNLLTPPPSTHASTSSTWSRLLPHLTLITTLHTSDHHHRPLLSFPSRTINPSPPSFNLHVRPWQSFFIFIWYFYFYFYF